VSELTPKAKQKAKDKARARSIEEEQNATVKTEIMVGAARCLRCKDLGDKVRCKVIWGGQKKACEKCHKNKKLCVGIGGSAAPLMKRCKVGGPKGEGSSGKMLIFVSPAILMSAEKAPAAPAPNGVLEVLINIRNEIGNFNVGAENVERLLTGLVRRDLPKQQQQLTLCCHSSHGS
jgi:hypothetical protein